MHSFSNFFEDRAHDFSMKLIREIVLKNIDLNMILAFRSNICKKLFTITNHREYFFSLISINEYKRVKYIKLYT